MKLNFCAWRLLPALKLSRANPPVKGVRILYIALSCYLNIALPVNVDDNQNLWNVLYSVQFSSVLKKQLVIGQFNFSFVFFIVSLITINRQTSYDSGIVRKGNEIIRGLPITIWVVPKRSETGGRNLPHRPRLCGPCIAAISGLEAYSEIDMMKQRTSFYQ